MSESEAVAYYQPEEFAKRLGKEMLTSLMMAEHALRCLSVMPDSHVQASFPDRWPGGRRDGEEFRPLSARQCADAESIIRLVYRVFQASEGRHQGKLHQLALLADRIRKSEGEAPSTPKRSEILRAAISRPRWWFERLTGETPNDHVKGWAEGAAGWIIDDLLRHRRTVGISASAKNAAIAAVRKRLPNLRIRRRDGGLDPHFLEVLALECLVALGKRRSRAKDDLSALRHEETRRVRGKS